MAVKDFNDFMTDLFRSAGLHLPGTHLDPEGDPVEFVFHEKQVNLYRYYRGKRGKMHCYSVAKDTKGWYWSWDYVPKKGTKVIEVKNAVRHRKKRAAISRALSRSGS
jgi:hypothetical protein